MLKEKLINFFPLLITVCFFRLPLTVITGFRAPINTVLNLIPLFLAAVIFFSTTLKSKSLFFKYTFLFSYAVTAILFGYYLSNIGSALLFIKEIFPAVLFLAFPYFIFSALRPEELEEILKKSLLFIIPIAFVLTFTEYILIKSAIVTPQDVFLWLKGFPSTSPLRINTFMGQGAMSGIISSAAFTYYFYNCLKYKNFKPAFQWQHIIYLILSFFTVLLSDSMTLILAILINSVFILYFAIDLKQLKKNKVKISLASILGILIFIILFRMSDLYPRFYSYFLDDKYTKQIYTAFDLYFLEVAGCPLSSLLIGVPLNAILAPGCSIGEFHVFFTSFKYGFLVHLGWWIFLSTPIYLFLKAKTLQKKFLAKEFAICISFLFPIIHYSGVELWGNNYIFAICLVYIYQKTILTNPTVP